MEEFLAAHTASPSSFEITGRTQGAAFDDSHAAVQTSWRCGVCGYCVLALGNDGAALPFASGPNGAQLPLRCPTCRAHHCDWLPVPTLDPVTGTAVNAPDALSLRVLRGANVFTPPPPPTPSTTAAVTGILPQKGEPFADTLRRFRAMDASSIANAAEKQADEQTERPQQTERPSASASACAPHALLTDPDVLAALRRLHSGGSRADGEEEAEEGESHDAGGGLYARTARNAPPPSAATYAATFVRKLRWGGGGASVHHSEQGRGAGGARPVSHTTTTALPEKHQRLPSNTLQFAATRLQQAPPPREMYACGRCGRRLQRLDGDGLLVPLECERGTTGAALPMHCAGCAADHCDWMRIPLLQRKNQR